MKNLLLAVAALVAALAWLEYGSEGLPRHQDPPAELPGGGAAFGRESSGRQLRGEGVVVRILPDDKDGSRHQRFVLRLASGQTILVAHNIDLAPRVAGLETGDRVRFNGVYEWNEKGGVVHWTHHDPDGSHEAGWIEHAGKTFQ